MAAKPEIKPTRATRRVLLVLLATSAPVPVYTIMRTAGTGSAGAYIALGRMERAGWVTGEFRENPAWHQPRRCYELTRQGRAKAIGLLGLEMPDGN